MQRGVAVYDWPEAKPLEVTEDLFGTLDAAFDWWNLQQHWDSEKNEQKGYRFNCTKGQYKHSAWGMTVGEAISRALEWGFEK